MILTRLQDYWLNCQILRHGDQRQAYAFFLNLRVAALRSQTDPLMKKAMAHMNDLPRVIIPPLRRK